jgi:hypothetical protein
MNDFLDLKIGTLRVVTIKNITKEIIADTPRGDSEKIRFEVIDEIGNEFKISDAIIINRKGEKRIQGFWLNTEKGDHERFISPSSALAKTMSFWGIDTLKQAIGLKVRVEPDEQNYLVFTTVGADGN